jgi:hypothetical protein
MRLPEGPMAAGRRSGHQSPPYPQSSLRMSDRPGAAPVLNGSGKSRVHRLAEGSPLLAEVPNDLAGLLMANLD